MKKRSGRLVPARVVGLSAIGPSSADRRPLKKPGKVFIGQILAESEDLDIILMLMAHPAGRKIIGSPYRISQDLIYTRQPLDDHGTSYALVPRDVAKLRAGLFDLTAATDQSVVAFCGVFD